MIDINAVGTSSQTKQPLVSSVIIFKNEERFLEEAIRSILAQTFSDWELLLVDDGSHDASPEIARWYAVRHNNVFCLHHPHYQNRGMSASRNLGVKNSKGKYVAFLDADDIWLPNKLEDHVSVLERWSDADLIIGPSIYRTATGDYVQNMQLNPGKLEGRAWLKCMLGVDTAQAAPLPSSLIIRRAAFDAVDGFVENFRGICEDLAFYFKLGLKATAFYDQRPYTIYRRHPSSACEEVTRLNAWTGIRTSFYLWAARYFLNRCEPGFCRQALRILWVHQIARDLERGNHKGAIEFARKHARDINTDRSFDLHAVPSSTAVLKSLVNAREFREALIYCRSVEHRLNPIQTIEWLYLSAYSFHQRGAYAEAALRYKTALKKLGQDGGSDLGFWLYYSFGSLCFETGQLEEAQQNLEFALKIQRSADVKTTLEAVRSQINAKRIS